MPERLTLADNVFFCIAQGQGVFLDLKQDAYSQVAIDQEPSDRGACLSIVIRRSVERYAEELLEAGLVRRGEPGGRAFEAYRSIPRPDASIFGSWDRGAFGTVRACAPVLKVRAQDVMRLLHACRSASRMLRDLPIADVVDAVRARRAGALSTERPADLARAVLAFGRLRPFYPRDYLCLFDSLALIAFLARHGLDAEWVFGVQTRPFAAHCWVQANGLLLNECVEYASGFTPIMIV